MEENREQCHKFIDSLTNKEINNLLSVLKKFRSAPDNKVYFMLGRMIPVYDMANANHINLLIKNHKTKTAQHA